MEAGLQGSRHIFSNKSHRDGLEERALPGPVIAGENRPASEFIASPGEIKVQFGKSPDVSECNLLNEHSDACSTDLFKVDADMRSRR